MGKERRFNTEVERWNDPSKDVKAIMRRSESGRRMLEDIERRSAGGTGTALKDTSDKTVKAEARGIGHDSPAIEKRTFGGALMDLMSCGRIVDPELRRLSRSTEGILTGSGVPTSAIGLFVPLSMESRAITSTGGPVGDFVAKLGRSLNDNLILSRLGVNRLDGLKGRSRICDYSGSTAKWPGETGTAQQGKGSFSKSELNPHRLTAYLNVSKMELEQNVSLPSFLADDLSKSISEAIERAVFGNEAHSDNRPDGFFTGKTITPIEATYANILSIEGSVRNNGMPMNWAMNGDCERRLKATQRNGSSIVTGGLCSDRPYLVSDMIPRITTGEGLSEASGHGFVYGRWSDFTIGTWGAMEVIYNPYTQSVDGMATFTVNFYVDWTWKADSFKVGAIK